MIAHNNPEIDYGQMALVNALMIKKNMGVPVCLVTDEGTIGWLKQNHPEELIGYAFDYIKTIEVDPDVNLKIFKDSIHMSKKLQYNNKSRISAYELSPFDETLLIDTDYLIQSDSLNNVWGSPNELMINKHIDAFGSEDYFFDSKQLTNTGIVQYWATVLYFRKGKFAELFFDLCQHIKENYSFYKFTYGFSGLLYRNDFVVSIALHILNGFEETNDFDLPNPTLLFTTDLDVLMGTPKVNELVFLIEKPKETGNYFAVNCRNTNVHVMNKYSINRHAERFIKLYAPENLQ